uniref:GED domain-containing protein n=1 Tax=Angiostrongylus cantonensis TaxID=6313 RepID=A0A0K0DLX9_ANGCA
MKPPEEESRVNEIKMRKRWKTTETKEQESSFGGTDKALKSIAENTEEITDEIEGESQENSRVAEIKRRVNITNTETADKMQELTELRILIIRIEELELANRKLTLQIRRMKKQLSEKERKIEELTSLVSFLQKTEEPEKPDEKPTSQQEATAVRGLEIMKRNQLLEHSVRNVERTMLCNFFEAVEPKPTQEIVMVIDRALSNAIDVLLMRPDKFDDFVDNELRIFLLDTQKAKRILLDVMLLHPEYVPRTWGGDVLAKRQSEARLEAMRKRQPAQVSDSKTNVEKENPRQNLAAPNGKSFAKTSAISKGVQLKSIRMAPNVMKTDQTPPPKSNPDTSVSAFLIVCNKAGVKA